MKKNKIILLFLALNLTVLTVRVYSQQNDFNSFDNETFFEKKAKLDKFLNEYSEKFDSLPKGWKQYKRAEAFWQSRLMPDGRTVKPKFLLNELKKVLAENNINIGNPKDKNYLQADKKWEAIGPFTVPNINGRGGNGKVHCVVIDPENENIIWVGAASGGLWRSFDKGNSWNLIPFSDIFSTGINDIVISESNPNIMYAATGDFGGGSLFKGFSLGIIKSIDRGNSWQIVGKTLDFTDSLSCLKVLVHPENSEIVYAATTQSILKSTDGGENWRTVISGDFFRDMKFKPNNPNVIYATTMKPWYVGGAKIMVSEDAGETWNLSQEFPNSRRIELAVTPANPELVFALNAFFAGHSGMEGLFVSRNSARSWDTLLHHSNQNSSYKDYVYAQSFYNLTIAISPTDENFIIAGGVLLGSTVDGGKTWIDCPSLHVDNHYIKFADSIIYCCNDGGINQISYDELYNSTATNSGNETSNNQKQNWKDLTNGLNITQYYRIGAHPYSDKLLIAGCQDNGTHLLLDSSWQVIDWGDGMECQFHPTNLNNIITTFQRGGGIGDSLNDNFPWVTEFAINPLNPDTVLLCGSNVWMKYNSDIGTVYEQISDFPKNDDINELRAIEISELDKNYIYTSSVYRLFYTKDYGKNWDTVYHSNATVSDITVSNDNPELFWSSHIGLFENEKVTEFLNGKPRNISFNLPNVAINCIEYCSTEKSLFVGTNIGVFTLKNGSEKWEFFNDGMPYVCVNEIEFVPATGSLYAATWGRGVWKYKLFEHTVIEPSINKFGELNICNFDLPLILHSVNKQEGYKYFWSNGSTEDSLEIYENGMYYLVGISPEGFSEISQIAKVNIIKMDANSENTTVTLLNRNPACLGDTVKYKLRYFQNSKDFPINFEWSNGSKDSIVSVTEPTNLYLSLTNSLGCLTKIFIDSVKFNNYPEIPSIELQNNLLICADSGDFRYQWLLDDKEIYAANERFLKIEKPGKYELIIQNETYCSAKSLPYSIDFAGDENEKIIKAKITPNPNYGKFDCEIFFDGKEEIELNFYDSNGGNIAKQTNLVDKYFKTSFDFSNYASGKYFLQIKVKDYYRTISFVIGK